MKDYMPRVIYTHASKMGGYMLFILGFFAELLGDGRFMVLALEAPKNQEQQNFVASMFREGAVNRAVEADGTIRQFRAESIAYAYNDEGKLIFVVMGRGDGWLSFARQSGVVVKAMGKVVKRLKAFNRPTLLGGVFDSLNIEVVEDDTYSREGLDEAIQGIINATPEHLRLSVEEYKERLLDGWLVISARVFREMLRQSKFHASPLRRELQIHRAKRAKVFNVRIMTERGFIKGNCTIGRNMTKGVDILVARSGIKEEIESSTHLFVIAEPQEMNRTVRTNAQTMINLPNLFRQADLDAWLKDFFAKAKADIKSGQLLSSYSDVENLMWKRMKALDVSSEGISSAMQYNVIEFVMRGGDYRKSPTMLNAVTRPLYQNLRSGRNLRIPVPCAVHAQVISESAATMAGHFIQVPQGALRFQKELQCFVSNDVDFIMDYDNHGGRDQDDFYDLFFRTMDGREVIVVVRSPNGKGEYSIYDYVDGDYFPTWTKANGSVISFPNVSGKGWPKRVSEALADGSLRYTGLPSANAEDVQDQSSEEFYAQETFLKSVNEPATGSVGMYINARMLWDLVFKGLRSEHICSLEDAIDTFVQAGAQVDRVALLDAATQLINEVVQSGRKIDEFFWTTRLFSLGLEEGVEVNLGEGPFTRAQRLLDKHITEFEAWVATFAAKNMALQDPRVNVLGGYSAAMTPKNQRSQADVLLNDFYQEASRLTKAWRRAVARENERMRAMRQFAQEAGVRLRSDEDRISADRWVAIFAPIMDKLHEVEQEQGIVARHNLAIALLCAAHHVQLRNGSLSDSIPWNAKYDEDGNPQGPFPYVMEALRFFGIFADVIDIDDDGILTKGYTGPWGLVCNNCGKTHNTTNPVTLQRFHLLGGLCKDCRS